MSECYKIYAEVNVSGKWYSLCPYYKTTSGEYKVREIYFAQSIFRSIYYDLEGWTEIRGIPDDISEGLRTLFPENLDEKIERWGLDSTWREYYRHYVFCVNFANAIAPRVNKDRPFKFEGYVTKRDLAAFECFEIEEFSEWLTEDEYRALPDKRKRQYVFHRWNEVYGDYGTYSCIASRIRTLFELFCIAAEYDRCMPSMEDVMEGQIRVYVVQS